MEVPAEVEELAEPPARPEPALLVCGLVFREGEPLPPGSAPALSEFEPVFPFSELAPSPVPELAESEASRPSEFFDWSAPEEDRASL